MRKAAGGLFVAMALLVSLSAAPPDKAKVHGFALSGTVASLDQSAKTFVIRSSSGRQTTLVWTDATKITGGSLAMGQKVTLRYLDKDLKHIATSIHIGPPVTRVASRATPSPAPTPASAAH